MKKLLATLAVSTTLLSPAMADDHGQNDLLDATVWTQTSVEYKANAIGTYKLASLMLDVAIADKSWTAVPEEQTGDFSSKPPAVILDLDETVMDNSAYQAWLIKAGKSYSSKTWAPFVNAEISGAIPGSLDFIKLAESRGVKIFYVSNRKAPLEEATRNNLKALGYPIDESEDTVILRGEKEEWKSSKKSPRRAYVADNYRVIMNFGDNFGDFTDAAKGSMADREAAMEKFAHMWGTKWFMFANPMYGTWESATFDHNWKLPVEERRQKKLDAMTYWEPAE
ncbi:5'-nucleotidase, lipoprotein e(P4) family [Curvivirga aplysinae]|uniref:5'-nucleotidase, lipoprotein e(P4) family n=1 Tax=Curvivirga aplysinae TaxID=2529852 RepID=UPI0012BD69ED|nr:HAD family acid phosphatase [Curvivirga aplysinae]MTI11141.1 acid phosphatase [Curvivirga aplysinae]